MSRFRLFDLNEAQHQAVTSTEGPLLILAGAGTGKTRVITARVAYLISRGVDPSQILAVTFTNKAANEMRERLAAMVEKEQVKKVTMSTFHALCLRLLRSGIERLGYKNNFTIYTESDQLGLIKKIITRSAAKDEKLDPHLAKNLISRAKNSGWNAPENEQNLVSAVFARYQTELKNLNAVDFDDLLLLAVKLLNEHPDVLEKWRARFRYVMVDEFQDTNGLQLQLVHLIGGGSRNVAVVGDDDQSIYGWRGAEVSNILEFEQHFPGPTIVKLEQNYRSTNAILGAANSLIKNNPRRRPKQLWSAHDAGEKVRIVMAPDDREEAQFVAEELCSRQAVMQARWEDFAVLYRMNAQSRLIEENLRRLKIPYRLIGGKSFFDRREVKDILSYANCLINPDDDVSLLRIINTPARGIGEAVTERALAFSVEKKMSLFRALQSEEFQATLSTRARNAIAAFAELIDGYETRIHTPLANYSELLGKLVEETGYIDDLKRSCRTPEEALGRESNLRDMLADLARYQEKSGGDLQGFLDDLALDKDREEEDAAERENGVTLITLHAAKGLEFPYVYLIGLEEGLLPHSRSKTEGTVDEERRLLYVGITRAMKTLTVTHCHNRLKFGSTSPCHPSSFIKELNPDCIEHVDLVKVKNTPVDHETAKSRFDQIRAVLGRG
ncbi:MAG TPA: UvrD-helicase domain-containing protein [Chthoniobacteraceae bacterium]|nr:UvrD-helicase domain-containing protein [Chthoniobacteraceae bacterium]